jgi:diguanylate cyclase (GGDEF)-like protein
MTLVTSSLAPGLPVVDGGVSLWPLSALVYLQAGIVVLDDAERVVFVNDWFVTRSGISAVEMTGRRLTDVFHNLIGSYFQARLQISRKTGFPAMLSHSLHAPQLPLYMPHLVGHPAAILSQTVHIIPMGRKASRQTGQGFTLVQVTDVTPTVRRESLLKTRVDEMHLMARVDALTGIGNRREFDETLVSEVRASIRAQSVLGMLLIDIDHFKAYNDRYGHPAGDKCLRQVAHVLQRVVRRPRDRVARYGGEELVVLLPGTPMKGVLDVGQDLLESVRAMALPHEGSKVAEVVTVSIGAATVSATSPLDGARLVRLADESLYAAKAAGRNRMCHPPLVAPDATQAD